MPSGPLKRPDFGRPGPLTGNVQKRGPNTAFLALIETVREHPGQHAVIARYRGGLKTTLREMSKDRQSLWHHLKTNHPLEDWHLVSRRIPETWGDRELGAIYYGLMTEEEAEEIRELRKKAFGRHGYVDNATRVRDRKRWVDGVARRRARALE